MGTYIKTFDQQTEYETYINSENVLLPNLSYCRDNNRAYFNKKDPYNGHEYDSRSFGYSVRGAIGESDYMPKGGSTK